MKAPRSKDVLRTQSTPDLGADIARAQALTTPHPTPLIPQPPPPLDLASQTPRGGGIARSKSWTETIFSPLFNVVPFLRPESEDSSEGSVRAEPRVKHVQASASSLTADETLESSEPEVEAAGVVALGTSTEATPSTYEVPSAYTIEETEEVFDW